MQSAAKFLLAIMGLLFPVVIYLGIRGGNLLLVGCLMVFLVIARAISAGASKLMLTFITLGLAAVIWALEAMNLDKIRKSYFFESDVLFRLNIANCVVADVPMAAVYGSEKSNMSILKVMFEFPWRHTVTYGSEFSIAITCVNGTWVASSYPWVVFSWFSVLGSV